MKVMDTLTLPHIVRALTLPDFDGQAAQFRMAPQPRPFIREGRTGSPRLAAVLMLIFPVPVADPAGGSASEQLHFALMKRNEYEGVHSGQVSLPGGSCEPGESWIQTALRETCEEFGVCDGIEVIGQLSALYVPPSDFEIHPVVGRLVTRPTWQPDPREVAAILEVPLVDLLDDSKKAVGNWTLRSGVEGHIPHYTLGDSVVWGATAIILSEFEGRLRAALDDLG